jgi:hypothetical protein
MDRATDFESVGCRFESCRARLESGGAIASRHASPLLRCEPAELPKHPLGRKSCRQLVGSPGFHAPRSPACFSWEDGHTRFRINKLLLSICTTDGHQGLILRVSGWPPSPKMASCAPPGLNPAARVFSMLVSSPSRNSPRDTFQTSSPPMPFATASRTPSGPTASAVRSSEMLDR